MGYNKTINIQEFQRLGYLQEVNRRFFHPLGLALAVDDPEDGTSWTLGSIWDEREDPEGWFFDTSTLDQGKADFIDAEIKKRRKVRESVCGAVIQPIGAELAD